ncbi:MFS transporter [Streptomyces sp. JJ36]|uniref:MFS transporter n=1 Tax=Streptomyces sp. JJ36 TaxID=2736645 RepID=UPI001F3572CA|nr:MFS transporter [Streptomyces sp. JJ36]MCF6525871.1 MFS transporter [Streptomyces sp. JJ36]
MTTLEPPHVRTAKEDEDDDGIAPDGPDSRGGPRGGSRTGARRVALPRQRARSPQPPVPSRLPSRWWDPRHPVAASMLLGSVLHLLWLWLIANGGGDLAAQDAWAEFVGRHPGSAYNLAWYGGMHPVSYSVISPYLMAVVGVRPVLILSGVLSSGVLALLLVRSRAVRRPMAPALWGAFAFAGNAASGRVTFALGTLFALLAVAALWAWPARWRRRRVLRGLAAALLSALATAGSPVAALFLEVVAAALFLNRRRAAALAIGVPPPVVVGASALLFPFTGVQPMPWVSVFFPLVASAGIRIVAPREWRTVRRSAEIYSLGIVLSWVIPSQVGSNAERMALLFGGVVLLALLPVCRTGARVWRGRRVAVTLVAFVFIAGFQIGKPVYDVVHTTPEAAWAHDLAPLLNQLQKADADRGRVEVVPVRSHREASALAPYVNLARGWNRQADTDRNPLFYEDGELTPRSYHDWLRRWAVRHVVLSTSDTPDVAAREEARIVRSGQPYLRLIWSDDNWELYRVTDPVPLAGPPAESSRAEAGGVTVRVGRPGEVLVRVPWSPWLGLVDAEGERIAPPDGPAEQGDGCLRKAEPWPAAPPPAAGAEPGEAPEEQHADGDEPELTDRWTVLEAPRAGTYRIAAPYRLPRGTPCPEGDGTD